MAKTQMTNEQRVNVARDLTLAMIERGGSINITNPKTWGQAFGEAFNECLKVIEKEYGPE